MVTPFGENIYILSTKVLFGEKLNFVGKHNHRESICDEIFYEIIFVDKPFASKFFTFADKILLQVKCSFLVVN